jgi:uncharacterized protein
MSIVPAFKKALKNNQRRFRSFLTRLERHKVPGIEKIRAEADAAAWKQTDCLACANCCRSMTPTFTEQDLKRISAHFEMTVDAFKKKWLTKDRSNGDWMNVKQPCQFLNLKDNKCSIYAIRPADCAGFPHHTKRNMDDYMHVYKQNVEYCPATYRWVERMKEKIEAEYDLYERS